MYHLFAIAAKQELDCIEDVAFPTAIEACNSIELWVESTDCGSVLIGFEAIENNLAYVHFKIELERVIANIKYI